MNSSHCIANRFVETAAANNVHHLMGYVRMAVGAIADESLR
jgi:hypothetical protein